MSFEETVVKLFADVKDEVHTQGSALNKVLSDLTESIRKSEESQNERIEAVETIVKPLTPLSNFLGKAPYIVIGAGAIVVGTGFSVLGLAIHSLNEVTGLNQVIEIEKKNTETLKRLCNYLELECK